MHGVRGLATGSKYNVSRVVACRGSQLSRLLLHDLDNSGGEALDGHVYPAMLLALDYEVVLKTWRIRLVVT